MTPLEIYAFFGAPLALLLFAGALVWITGWQDKRAARDRHHAAE